MPKLARHDRRAGRADPSGRLNSDHGQGGRHRKGASVGDYELHGRGSGSQIMLHEGSIQKPFWCMTGSRMSLSAFIPAWLGWTG
jgi:hypothetical protein